MKSGGRACVICLTPVKNEAWILDRFLQGASQWADHIAIADQQSDDGSCERAQRYPRVVLVENPSSSYDEGARQRLLLEAARRLPVAGKRILLALDADEMLTANWRTSPEWQQIMDAPAGTVLYFQWVNVTPGLQHGWIPEEDIPFGFVDDGTPHEGSILHSRRLPVPAGAPRLVLREIKVLHFQYADWQRMKSKQRWYQCWERLHHPAKRPITIYRQYHFMDADVERAVPLERAWLEGYERAGIDMHTVNREVPYRWDRELVELFQQHGADPFRRLNVWDVDWATVARSCGYDVDGTLDDPRSPFERAVHRWLARTQPRAHTLRVRAVQKVLQVLGW